MPNLFNFLYEGEDEITLKNASRVISQLMENIETLQSQLESEINLKNKLLGFILSKGLMDEYSISNPPDFNDAIKTLSKGIKTLTSNTPVD
jgi:hypothetical protein